MTSTKNAAAPQKTGKTSEVGRHVLERREERHGRPLP